MKPKTKLQGHSILIHFKTYRNLFIFDENIRLTITTSSKSIVIICYSIILIFLNQLGESDPFFFSKLYRNLQDLLQHYSYRLCSLHIKEIQGDF